MSFLYIWLERFYFPIYAYIWVGVYEFHFKVDCIKLIKHTYMTYSLTTFTMMRLIPLFFSSIYPSKFLTILYNLHRVLYFRIRAEQYGSFLVEILKLGFQCTNMIPYPNSSSSMCVASNPPSMVFGGSNILLWHLSFRSCSNCRVTSITFCVGW